jgi:hypothetical protein
MSIVEVKKGPFFAGKICPYWGLGDSDVGV